VRTSSIRPEVFNEASFERDFFWGHAKVMANKSTELVHYDAIVHVRSPGVSKFASDKISQAPTVVILDAASSGMAMSK